MKSEKQNECMVTVTLLTYFHKKHIRECLDSVVKQKTDFKFEVLVGDDGSKDGTRRILREYERKYPEIFKLVLRPKNLGPTRNLYDLLKRAGGKYIAGLEGDDYWTDEHKLQKQVDFLEQHPEYIGCSHEVTMVDDEGKEIYLSHKYIEGRHWAYYKPVFTYEDYQKFELPGQGSSYVYRNIFLAPKHDYSIIETASPMVGDMTLMLILTAQGDWYYMQGKNMAAYRFVIKEGGKNWASWRENSNRTATDFIYRVRLEEYARKVLHKKLDLPQQKFELFYVAYWAMRANREVNGPIFDEICKYAKPFWYYWGRLYLKRFLDHYILSNVIYAKRHGELDPEDSRLASQTWQDFDRAAKGKRIVAFGEGVSFTQFMHKYKHRYEIPVVLDNAPAKWGLEKFFDYGGGDISSIVIKSPDSIKKWKPGTFVILIATTLFYKGIAKQLDEMGIHDYYVLGIMESKLWYYRLCDRWLPQKWTMHP
ncbi:MAG: glycosyltransferase [Selenomonas sp.]|nr:glycosyltransferase [Selenomonas sp.]